MLMARHRNDYNYLPLIANSKTERFNAQTNTRQSVISFCIEMFDIDGTTPQQLQLFIRQTNNKF